jgi:hypothetical protein
MTEQEARQEIVGELEAGELVLWAGVPKQGLTLRGTDAFLIPFSLLWGGFAIFWEASVVASGAPLFFALWGIPFVGMGLYLIFGRFFVDARQRARIAYGLTDKRVIIRSGLFSRSVKSLTLRTLSDVTLTESGDGSGTITFGPSSPWARGMAGWPGYAAHVAPSFELIPDAKQVYARLRTAQSSA